MVKIVVLDGYTLNPGDLRWDGLSELGDLTVYDRTDVGDIAGRAADADIVLTNKTPLSKETIDRLPALRYIGVLATGYNVVHIETAAARGIPVCNVPSYGTHTVAQFVFALILECVSRVALHDRAVKDGEWAANPDFCFTKAPLVELHGKTLGLVGLGRIGKQVARIALAMDMRVLATGSGRRPNEPVPGIEWCGLDRLLAESDIVSLHCPLTSDTEHLINRETIGRMKPSALLINTARGPLIRESDLAEALREGRIAGAALDVLTVEPPKSGSPLLDAPNCIVTPHIAWATREARTRLMEVAVDNVRSFLAGTAANVVNGLK